MIVVFETGALRELLKWDMLELVIPNSPLHLNEVIMMLDLNRQLQRKI